MRQTAQGRVSVHRYRRARATWARRSSRGGALLRWSADQAPDGGLTVWHVADEDTEWFSPSSASFTVNDRVDALEPLLEQLRRERATMRDPPG